MKKFLSILFVTGMVSLPLVASAETPAPKEKNEEHDALEVAIHGGLALPIGGVKTWYDSVGAKTGVNTGFDVGYYLDQQYVLGLSFNYAQFAIDSRAGLSSQHHRVYSPAFFLKRYFPSESNFAPYLLVRAGIDFPKFSTFVYDVQTPKYRELSYSPNFSFTIGAGAHYYTSDFSGIYVEAGYHMAFTKHSETDYQNRNFKFGQRVGMIDLRAGIVAFFGSSK